ncbi:hypothetical protein HK405_013748, partial [Cladochytrium tenue]
QHQQQLRPPQPDHDDFHHDQQQLQDQVAAIYGPQSDSGFAPAAVAAKPLRLDTPLAATMLARHASAALPAGANPSAAHHRPQFAGSRAPRSRSLPPDSSAGLLEADYELPRDSSASPEASPTLTADTLFTVSARPASCDSVAAAGVPKDVVTPSPSTLHLLERTPTPVECSSTSAYPESPLLIVAPELSDPSIMAVGKVIASHPIDGVPTVEHFFVPDGSAFTSNPAHGFDRHIHPAGPHPGFVDWFYPTPQPSFGPSYAPQSVDEHQMVSEGAVSDPSVGDIGYDPSYQMPQAPLLDGPVPLGAWGSVAYADMPEFYPDQGAYPEASYEGEFYPGSAEASVWMAPEFDPYQPLQPNQIHPAPAATEGYGGFAPPGIAFGDGGDSPAQMHFTWNPYYTEPPSPDSAFYDYAAPPVPPAEYVVPHQEPQHRPPVTLKDPVTGELRMIFVKGAARTF